MYTSFYNLSELPFTISTDPRFLWLGEKHQEALANLKYGLLEANGYVVLTGDVGTGKTTLVNALIETLDDNVLVANINHPTLDTVEFFNLVAKTYDASVEITGKTEFLLFFHSFLRKSYAEGKVVLLVIDEAHRLSKELLEEIRLLSNIEQKGVKLINIFFVGQNELKEVILCPQCRALRQRITLFYDIEPLSQNETLEYMTHRLKMAGAREQLFTTAAIREIQKFSRGYPRLINILCGRAMLTGYVKEQKKIDRAIVMECAREISFLDPKPSGLTDMVGILSNRRSNWFARLGGKAAALKKSRYTLIPTGLAGIFALIVIAMGIRLQTQSLIKNEASAGIDVSELESESAISAGREASAFPRKQQDEVEPFSAGKRVEIRKIEAEVPHEEVQALKQDAPEAPKKEDVVVKSLPIASGEPLGEKKALPAEVPPRKEPLENPPQLTKASVEKPLKLHQPTTLELASAALQKHNFQMAIDLFEADRGRDTVSDPIVGEIYSRALVGRAEQIMAGSPDESETLLRKAVDINPKNYEAHLNLGKMYTRSKEYALAIDAYRNAGDLNPKLSDAFFNLGFIYAITGMYEDAEKLFARVVELEPLYLDKALFNLAVIQERLGKTEECLTNLQMAVMIRPENQKAQSHLKRLLLDMEGSRQ
jgi:type II secretory pathway predicted ATPase ExeA/tetratricopeptide (TPR) repeat protein